MEAILFTTGAFVYGAFMAYFLKTEFEKRKAVFREAAEELGLRPQHSFLRWDFGMGGTFGATRIEVGESKERKKEYATRFRLTSSRLPKELGLSLEEGGGWLQIFGRRREDHLVGESSFDEKIIVQGPPVEALARLDAETRRLLLRELEWKSTSIAGGSLVRNVPDRLTAKSLTRHVRTLLEVVRSLQLHGSHQEALARNAERDPVAGVRLRNLEVLQSEFPSSLETMRACRGAVSDQDPAVRLQGAAHLGGEGLSTLLELAVPADPTSEERAEAARHGRHLPGVPPHVQVEALRHLLHACDARCLEVEEMERVLREQLARGEGRSLRLAVQMVGHLRLESCLDLLHRLLVDADEETAAALADTFRRLHLPSAEDDLLVLLRHPSERVRIRTVMALEVCGTIRSVEPLRQLPALFQLRKAVDSAVAAIQSRIEGAEAGQLSLVETEGDRGALSLVEVGEQGDLTIVEGEAGRGRPA